MKKTMTPSQLEANRRNAAKSTGPRTPEGKAKVAANSVTHGLSADNVVSRNEKSSLEALTPLSTELKRIFKPQTDLENDLISQIVAGYWRLNNMYRFEAVAIRKVRAKYEAQAAAGQTQAGARPPVLPDDFELNILLRHEGRISTYIHRAWKKLQRIHSRRRIQARLRTIDTKPDMDLAECSTTKQTHPAILAE